MTRRSPRSATALAGAGAVALLLSGCADDRAFIGQSEDADVGTVALQSDDSTAVVPPVCVGDIPEDLTACAGAPQDLGLVELDETRTATLAVPLEVATGGYRVFVDGEPLPRLDGILEERHQVLRIPPSVVAGAEETVLTVRALRSREHPMAVWQFLLSDPAGPPD